MISQNRDFIVKRRLIKHFVALYDTLMKEDPYSPLIIDLSPKYSDAKYQLRKNAFPWEYLIIFELQ